MGKETAKEMKSPPVDYAKGKKDDKIEEIAVCSAAGVAGYALYYPLVSEWEHPDGIRFDQPRD